MLLYKNNYQYNDPLNVVFLCGSQYTQSDQTDKRNILKAYIEKEAPECQAIILEENFKFKESTKKYLGYDDIFLKCLSQIEQLAALYASKIIIIHETISTAAELGMFAIEESLAPKICLLTPDDISVEENKLSSFIRLAFNNSDYRASKIARRILFYPDVDIVRKSPNKSDYYTYFHNNEIGENLGRKIISFIRPEKSNRNFKVISNRFGKGSIDHDAIDYFLDSENSRLEISLYPETLKVQLLALFFIDDFRREIRKQKQIHDHVSFIEKYYKEIMLSTISDISGKQLDTYNDMWYLRQASCSLRQAIGYYLYMLQAIKYIGLEQVGDDCSIRKITLKEPLEKCRGNISSLIFSSAETAFGRLSK